MLVLKVALLLFALAYIAPLGVSALLYRWTGTGTNWWTADRSSAGFLPQAATHRPAVVRVFSAPTVRWRGIFAVHCWIVLKAEDAPTYSRYDYTAWGEPIRLNGFEADGRWFGRVPEVVFAAEGDAASGLIPRLQACIDGYAFRNRGDYGAWPGPNSNTFVAAVLDAIPEAKIALPPNAIGKDYPYDGRWLRPTSPRLAWF
jgi:hypothetical protein